ncbi:hypothetical protein XbC2_512 [Xanthomonas phage XbC2]|nr:hypothetical protein XbC2_512 [Xanthomonas phage XbC2]
MEDSLINRTNIVRRFIREMPNMEISREQSSTERTVLETEELEIIRIIATNELIFKMVLECTVTEEQYVEHNFVVPGGGGYRKVQNTYKQKVEVMKFLDGKFSMVNAESNSNWIRFSYVAKQRPDGTIYNTKELQTTLNIGYKVLPNSEESHFQRMTTDGLVLELPECIAIWEILERCKEFGSLVQATPDIKVHLYF